MTQAWIGAGSNVGSRTDFVRRGVYELDADPGIEVEARSSLYETSPLGGPPQRSFVNLVTRIRTVHDPRRLLEVCKGIERKTGRVNTDMRWGPRVLDLDILLFGDEKISEGDLEIPHPRIAERRFVLVPLLEIDPDITDPWGGRYDAHLEESLGDVELLEPF